VRVYVPATISLLRRLVSDGELRPVGGTAFAVTPALRESYASGDTEELEYAAMADAARASLRLLSFDLEPDAGGTDAGGTDAEGTDADGTDAEGTEGTDAEGTDADGTDAGGAGAGGAEAPRRVVVCADVDGVRLRPDLDDGAVTLPGPVPGSAVAAVYVDLPEAGDAVRAAALVVDAADLGDPDAEFTVGDADDHELAWYAPQEVPFLLELL
jgi:hypothetical protein